MPVRSLSRLVFDARRLAGTVALAGAVVLPGCVSARPDASPSAAIAGLPVENGTVREGEVSSHVVLMSLDGLRPDAIEAFGAPTLGRLLREGSYTLSATTILPSKTLPSHTSMLTGEDVDDHGVTWNSNQVDAHGHVAVPTVFDVAHARGFRTAAFFSKTKFEHLQRAGGLDYTQAPANGLFGGKWPVSRTVGDVERYLERQRPNLLFVHVGEPDYAGHAHGWMSSEYGRAVRAADDAVARVMAAADRAFGAGEWTLIVTADHGGHGRGHGSHDPRDITIPWIAWGRGVRAGEPVSAQVRTFDTASTVLWLLGLSEPGDWAGTPVTSAFHAPVRLAGADRE